MPEGPAEASFVEPTRHFDRSPGFDRGRIEGRPQTPRKVAPPPYSTMRTSAVPTMASRVTIPASFSSAQPSVPSGCIGRTR